MTIVETSFLFIDLDDQVDPIEKEDEREKENRERLKNEEEPTNKTGKVWFSEPVVFLSLQTPKRINENVKRRFYFGSHSRNTVLLFIKFCSLRIDCI